MEIKRNQRGVSPNAEHELLRRVTFTRAHAEPFRIHYRLIADTARSADRLSFGLESAFSLTVEQKENRTGYRVLANITKLSHDIAGR